MYRTPKEKKNSAWRVQGIDFNGKGKREEIEKPDNTDHKNSWSDVPGEKYFSDNEDGDSDQDESKGEIEQSITNTDS